jgi:uncharacterized membrane protein
MGARLGAAAFWLVAGTMHFAIPRQYEAIVPPSIARWKKEVVVASARWWLLATLAAVYPANIHMALHPEQFPKIPPLALYVRLPIQGLFALLTWRGTR